MFFLFLVILVILLGCVYYVFPKSEIPIRTNPSNYKIELKIENGREFEVLSEDDLKMVDEIFSYRKGSDIPNPNPKYNVCLFKDFDCVYYTNIPRDYVFGPYTLIYFPSNDVKWNSGKYLYDSTNDKYYFPEPNSMICIDGNLTWTGDRDINVVVGKRKNKIIL